MVSVKRILGILVIGLAAAGAAWFLGMRTKNPTVINAQRRLNRSFFNPRELDRAGAEGAANSIIEHTGRTSGRTYRTPLEAVPTEDGFVMMSVYGPDSDWVQNVLAAGSATVVRDGQRHRVENPELVPFEQVSHYFSPSTVRAHRVFDVREGVVVQTVVEPSA